MIISIGLGVLRPIFAIGLTRKMPGATIVQEMKLLARLLQLDRKNKRKTLVQYEQEAASRYAKEQFQKLKERGLSLPIALL